MIDEQIKSVREPLREAYRSVLAPETTYIRKETIELEETADQDPWFPSERTGSLIDDIHTFELVFIDDGSDLDLIFDDLVRSVNIGLVLMGQEVSRRKKPQLIILTTESRRFYIIEPNDLKRGISLLQKILTERRVKIWTTNGLYEADCLNQYYGIKLLGTQARCCTGLHINLMRIMKPLPNYADRMLSMYPPAAIRASRVRNQDMSLESYEELAMIWLDADPSDLYCDKKQFIHLNVRPLDLTAMNLIKKRCCLVLKLAQELTYYTNVELNAMNTNTINCLAFTKNSTLRLKLREEIKDCESKGIASVQYFAHLNGIFATNRESEGEM